MFLFLSAFSVFSVCEYVIAYTNMGYHFTGYLDFKGCSFSFGQLCTATTGSNNHQNTNGLAVKKGKHKSS